MKPLFRPEALLDAGMEPELVEKIGQAYSAIRGLIDKDVPLAAAVSFGKDSTAMLIIMLLAQRDAVRENPLRHPLTVLSADTLIENPVVAAHVRSQIATLKSYARRHSIPLNIRVGQPTLASSWIVSVCGGRKIPTFLNASQRDCSIYDHLCSVNARACSLACAA